MSPTPAAAIEEAVAASALLPTYGTSIDRESAREILTARMNAAHEAFTAAEAAKEKAKLDAEYAKQQSAIDKARAAADKKAQQEYERLLRRTAGSTRTTSRRAPKTPMEQILGSRSADTLLTGVIRGLFGTGRR